MIITMDTMRTILGDYVDSPHSKIDDALLEALNEVFSHDGFGLGTPTAQALFLGICSVESDRFRTFEEYADGSKYEGDMDLGNTEPGDGELFKGQGVIQLTGRRNTQRFANWMGDQSIMENPKRISKESRLALMSGVYYWAAHNAKDTSRTCALVAEDLSLSMEEKARRTNCIVYRGREVSTREIAHWDLRLEYTQNAAKVLGVTWATLP